MRKLPALLFFAALSLSASVASGEESITVAARLEETVRALAANPTRHTASKDIAVVKLWLRDRLAKLDGLKVELQSYKSAKSRRLAEGVEVTNVVATLRGRTAPDRVLVVSGHYDSRASDVMDEKERAPGANDDASGVAVVLELARRFAALPAKQRPEKTIVFLCVAGEEQGLLGARHFARNARQNRVRIEAMFTNDIVGNTRAPDGKRVREYVRLFSEGTPATGNPMQQRLRRALGAEWDSPSRQLARYVHAAAARHLKGQGFSVKLVFRPDRFLRGGDHLAFNDVGYAAVRFTEPHEDYRRQHQDVREGFGDTPDHVDYEYLARVAQVNFVALRELANAPSPPRGVSIHVKQLENPTTLSWEAPVAKDLSHYEVVWRDTTAALWQKTRRVEGLTVTLKASKDDWHFGVRAVDKDGNRSLVVYPRPLRRERAAPSKKAKPKKEN